MTNNEIIAVIIATLRTGMSDVSGLTVQQSYQPTDQGVPEGPTLFLHIINDVPYGFPAEKSTYNEADGDFDTVESDVSVISFQVSAQYPDDVGNVSALTAVDLCNKARRLMQVRSTLASLRSSGLKITRISQVRITHIENDKGYFEEMPSFDFDLFYDTVVATRKTPRITAIDKGAVSTYRV